MVALARGELGSKGVALREELAPNLTPLLRDRVQLQQVMLNLMTNAIEAMSAAPGSARQLPIARGMRISTYAWRWKIRAGLDSQSTDRVFEASTPRSRTEWAWGRRSAAR